MALGTKNTKIQKIIFITILIAFLSTACAGHSGPKTVNNFMFDTVVSITYYNDSDLPAVNEALNLGRELESVFSRTLPESELYRLNESGSMTVSAPLLEVIRETYSAYAEDYQQTFIYDVPESLPDVTGNPDRTQQVLIALLDNAFKYSSDDGTVTLSCRVDTNVIRVTVRDTGIGISESDLPHVFDRFYKADKSHGGKGTGLGLAIAYEIMKQLGEDMYVESTLGEGSAFSFTLHIAA